MTGGYWVLLVVDPKGNPCWSDYYQSYIDTTDYHWYRQNPDGTWSHKPGETEAIHGVINPIEDATQRHYTNIVGFFYVIKRPECGD